MATQPMASSLPLKLLLQLPAIILSLTKAFLVLRTMQTLTTYLIRLTTSPCMNRELQVHWSRVLKHRHIYMPL